MRTKKPRPDLYEAIRKMDMRPKELAYMIGVHPSAVSHWVSGARRPSYEQAVKIKRITGVEMDYYLVPNETAQDS